MNGKYDRPSGFGALVRELTRAQERAAAGDESTGPILHVGTSAPTDGSVFWYDTDDTC